MIKVTVTAPNGAVEVFGYDTNAELAAALEILDFLQVHYVVEPF